MAERLNADKMSISNWETNRTKPGIRYMGRIVGFLGYNPLPPGTSWAEGLVNARTALGLTQREAARRAGVDQGTLAKWERGEREPRGRFLILVNRFLNKVEDCHIDASRAG